MPMFSVIMPIYRVEKFLDKAVQSVLEQSFKDFELILVDDGSTDLCPQKCDEYAKKDNRVKVIHKKNGGLVSARKSGADIATGNYIINVDGDDWIADECFLELSNIITECSPDMICFEHFIANDQFSKQVKMSYRRGLYNKKEIEKYFYPILIENERGIYFEPSICAKAIRSDLYIRNQLAVNSNISIGEDHACTKPCIFEAESIYILRKPLYYYRINSESMTKGGKPFSWSGAKDIGIHFEEKIDMTKSDFQEQVYRNVVHNLFNIAVSQFDSRESYADVKLDIKKNISESYYKNAIKKCRYKKNIKGTMAHISLKYQLVFLMFLYNRYKKIKRKYF